jgi:hypothetical protein
MGIKGKKNSIDVEVIMLSNYNVKYKPITILNINQLQLR